MTDDFQPIRPRRVPLAHAQGAGTAERARHRARWALPLAAVTVIALLFATFTVIPRYFTPDWTAATALTPSRPKPCVST